MTIGMPSPDPSPDRVEGNVVNTLAVNRFSQDQQMTKPSPEAPGHETLRPHRPLTAYYADEAERHRWLQQMFDRTAADYDRIEGLVAFGTGPKYRREAGFVEVRRHVELGIYSEYVCRKPD